MKPSMRIGVLLLASTSIAALLGEMYGWWPMGLFTFAVFLPSCAALIAVALHDRWRGDGRTFRIILIGAAAGFVAALSYDVFRLPFVFAARWGLDRVLPALPLFKVFPQFGARILGTADAGSMTADVTGWAYHFSNGVTFGVIYAALADGRWRTRWPIGILFAVGLELAMLLTPYPATFGIRLTTTFVVVTLAAHLLFGIAMVLSSVGLEGWLTKS